MCTKAHTYVHSHNGSERLLHVSKPSYDLYYATSISQSKTNGHRLKKKTLCPKFVEYYCLSIFPGKLCWLFFKIFYNLQFSLL